MSTVIPTKVQLFADLYEDGVTVDVNTINKAKNGDGQAMWSIGYNYKNEKQIYDKALAWYRLAAVKNNSTAQNSIGVLYHSGLGVPQDYLLAIEWFLKAAAQNKGACGNMGHLFENGQGIPVNKYKALEWYTKSGDSLFRIEILKDQGIELTQQDKNKPIDQLIMETENIMWVARKNMENELKEENIILKKEIRAFRAISERKKTEIDDQRDTIEEHKREIQTLNVEMQSLKLAVRTLELKLDDMKDEPSESEKSTKIATKKLQEVEQARRNLEKLLEQERQLRDNEIALMKQKMEQQLEKEKQKRSNLERSNQAMKKELKSLKTPSRNNPLPKNKPSNNETDTRIR